MCNAYEQHVKWVEYTRMMQEHELGIPTQQSELDLPQSDMTPMMRAAGNVVELAPMNFSFAPSGPKSGPVFNFRSEGRDFSKSLRCLIPASGFFEFMWTLIDVAIWKAQECALSGCERRLAIALS